MKKVYGKTPDKLNSIMNYIAEFNEEYGYCPSLREIGIKLNISTPSLVKYYVDMLEKSGHIYRGEPPRRVITLSPEKKINASEKSKILDKNEKSVFHCPILGQVAAGLPILATENILGYYPLPYSEFDSESTFMLKIVGDSMIDAGINDGDIVIVDKEKSPENSKIVVALLEDSATVKRFFKKRDTIILHPENPSYNDIVISQNENINILGVVVGLIRKF